MLLFSHLYNIIYIYIYIYLFLTFYLNVQNMCLSHVIAFRTNILMVLIYFHIGAVCVAFFLFIFVLNIFFLSNKIS